MSTPEQHVSVLQAEMRRLEAFVRTLAHEDWQRSSRCDQWTVADVVAHLTAMDQYGVARIVRGLHGDTSPPPEVPTIVGQAADIAHYAIAVRQRLGDDLLPTFLAAQRAFHATLATIGPADWDTPGSIDEQGLQELATGCDLMIIPAIPESSATDGLLYTLHRLQNGPAHFRVLLNRVKHNRPQEAAELRAALTEMGVKVFATEIPDLVAFDKASSQGVPVYEADARRAGRAWEAFEALGEEIRHG